MCECVCVGGGGGIIIVFFNIIMKMVWSISMTISCNLALVIQVITHYTNQGLEVVREFKPLMVLLIVMEYTPSPVQTTIYSFTFCSLIGYLVGAIDLEKATGHAPPPLPSPPPFLYHPPTVLPFLLLSHIFLLLFLLLLLLLHTPVPLFQNLESSSNQIP